MLHPVPRPSDAHRSNRILAVVLDWAGTTVDFGSCAPVAAMRAAFEQARVPVTEGEARRPMGKAKRDHISAILGDNNVSQRWQAQHQRPPGDDDLDRIYREFLELQTETVATYSAVIPGCNEAIGYCRELGIKIGSSTGYTRPLLDRVMERAEKEGYRPDLALSADDVSPGRPAPWLCIENAKRLNVYPMSAVAKVDDTPAGVTSGRNAGAWSVGVLASGNEVGLSLDAFEKLPSNDRDDRLQKASKSLSDAGAHLLIDTIADLPDAINHLNSLLSDGQLPN